MAKSLSSSMEVYINSLDVISLSRYKDKISQIGGADPYQLTPAAFTSDRDMLPPIRNEDIVEYLVFAKSSYTMTEFKSMKSLQAHNQMTSGFVHDLRVHNPLHSSNSLVMAKVYHSQRMNEKPTQPWVIADPAGRVLSAHCTCIAGLGETCCHVAAVLFTVDTANRIKETRSVTDVTPYWGQPVFKEVAYAEGSAIDFTSASSRKQQLDASLAQNTPKRRRKAMPIIEKTTQNELKLFYDTIQFKNSKIKPAILSLVEEYAADYSSSTDKLESLTSLNDDMLKGADFQTILSKIEEIFTSGKLSLDVKECEIVEQKTRHQAKSALWHSLRTGRVTASKLHHVCHTNPAKPSLSLITQMCKPAKNTKQTPAMKWGTEQESTARKHYEQQIQAHHSDFNVRNSGLVLNPKYPHMAASPDGICQCKCCGIGCIEIKCPFSARDMMVREALALPGFPLQLDETKLTLKPTHPYYAQVQCQMFISNTQYCDFVVWTQKDLFVERISRDEDFWTDACKKAEHFFKVVALPELLCGYFTQNLKASTSLTAKVNSAQHGGVVLPP